MLNSGANLPLARFSNAAPQPVARERVRPGAERRGAPRHVISAPVRFANGGGVSVNVSQSGILFETDSELEAGKVMKLTLVGEPAEGSDKPIYLLCDVFLLRVQEVEHDEAAQRFRVAAAIKAARVH